MIKSKEDLKDFLSYESKKYGKNNTNIPLFCITEKHFLWKHNFLLRKTEYHVNNKNMVIGTIYKVLLKRYQNKHKLHIPINAFDKGLKIMHLGPILVNGGVKGGKDISLHINTSLAAGGADNDAPILDDGVVMGVGSVILGGVHLSRNIAVGANALVNKSFDEENIAIAGVPAKKVSETGRLNWGNNKERQAN